MSDKSLVADALGIESIMRAAMRSAEKKAKLSPVLLQREHFAKSSVSTGSLCLDKILGGGIPGGRIVGISGPERAGKTLLVTQIGSNQASQSRFFLHLDAEGSTDPIFLAARGIDFDKYRGKRNKNGELLPGEVDYVNFYQPSTVEQITEYIHSISSALPENRNPPKPVCIYALDSVVALITDDIDSDVVDSNKMAMHAKAYATYLPIINSDLVKSGSTLLYVNQLRQKPMQAYGCLQGDVPILFVDGRVHKIKDIVDNKIEGYVWSYVDGYIKPAKIVNWYDNGTAPKEDWIRVVTEGPGSKNGLYSVVTTKNHKILKSDGVWVESQDLRIGDEIVSKYEESFEDGSLAEQFLVGALVGDSCVPNPAINRNKNILILCNNEQKEYLAWKVDKLKAVLDFKNQTIYNKKADKHYEVSISKPNISLGVLSRKMVKRDPSSILNKLTWLSVAIWYMDDGCSDFTNCQGRGSICFKRLRNNKTATKLIEDWFTSRGVLGTISNDNTSIIFNTESFMRLCDNIAEFIPECMQYKLPSSHRNRYKDFDLVKGTKSKMLPVAITKIVHGLGHKSNRKFDLQIEGSQNYLAGHSRGGIIVHNSPFYEPAGDALKFFASARMMLSASKPKLNDKDHPFIESEVNPGVAPKEGGVWEEAHLDNQGKTIGVDKYIYTGIKTVKNKIYTPFQKCWMRIQFEENGSTGHGLDPVFDIFTFLFSEGYIIAKKKERGEEFKTFKASKCDQFDPVREIGMPDDFRYHEFKTWVRANPQLTSVLRDKLLVTGIVYSKDECDKIDENVKREAEEAEAAAEITDAEQLESMQKKGRGRPKSAK